MKVLHVLKARAGVMLGVTALALLGTTAAPVGTFAESVPAADSGCVLPSEPWDVPAALDSAITGPADKDRACMKALCGSIARCAG